MILFYLAYILQKCAASLTASKNFSFRVDGKNAAAKHSSGQQVFWFTFLLIVVQFYLKFL